MTRITVKFTAKEIDLLSRLVSDQLFRKEFIDSRLPGSPSDSYDLTVGKKLAARLQSVAGRVTRQPNRAVTIAGKSRSRVVQARDRR